GEASRLALAIDAAVAEGKPELAGVAGTVAGDDTIFVATRDERGARRALALLAALARGGGTRGGRR
ncbi:MAG: hypothetical protein D6718_09875, partial [Acidobacteria bacterium]